MQRTTIFLAFFLALNLTITTATPAATAPKLHINLSPDNSVFMEFCPARTNRTALFSKNALAILDELATNFTQEVAHGDYRTFDHSVKSTPSTGYSVGRIIGCDGLKGLCIAPRIIACTAEAMIDYMMHNSQRQFDFSTHRTHGTYHERPFEYLDHALSIKTIVYGIKYGQPHIRYNYNERTKERTRELCFITPCVMHYHNIKPGTPDYTEKRWLKLTFDCPPKQQHTLRLCHACLHDAGRNNNEIPCSARATTDKDGDIIFNFGH